MGGWCWAGGRGPAAGASVRLFAHLAARRAGTRCSPIRGSGGWISKVLLFYLGGSGFGDPVNPCEMGTPIRLEDLERARVIMNCVFTESSSSQSLWPQRSRGVLSCLIRRVSQEAQCRFFNVKHTAQAFLLMPPPPPCG